MASTCRPHLLPPQSVSFRSCCSIYVRPHLARSLWIIHNGYPLSSVYTNHADTATQVFAGPSAGRQQNMLDISNNIARYRNICFWSPMPAGTGGRGWRTRASQTIRDLGETWPRATIGGGWAALSALRYDHVGKQGAGCQLFTLHNRGTESGCTCNAILLEKNEGVGLKVTFHLSFSFRHSFSSLSKYLVVSMQTSLLVTFWYHNTVKCLSLVSRERVWCYFCKKKNK